MSQIMAGMVRFSFFDTLEPVCININPLEALLLSLDKQIITLL